MIDARGLSCPTPVVMTNDEINNNKKEIEVLVDSMVCVENISRLANNKGYNISYTQNEDEFIIKLIKI